MHIAIVDEELPFPLNSGKRIRTFELVARLARMHSITYVCHRNATVPEWREAKSAFAELGVETVGVEHVVPSKSGPAFYALLAANLASPLPYSVASHTSVALQSAVLSVAKREPVDLWQVEWTPYTEALRGLPRARHLIMAHNVESLIWRRYEETERDPLKRWYIGLQRRKFEAFERSAFARATRVVAVSPEDARIIREDFGQDRVDVVDNGVDVARFRVVRESHPGAEILFLGSLDWRPNLDGIEQFLDIVLPAVRAQLPEARLTIVGRNPPEWLSRRVAASPGVDLHANVPDVRPFLARAAVMAVPLRIGGGSRLKILEAMAAGLPVVSTRIGAEGLALEPDRHFAEVVGIQSMAPAIVASIRNPDLAAQRAEAGRRLVAERYDWNLLADRLDRIWRSVVSEPARGRTSEVAIP